MPIYEYKCADCGATFQALRKMSQADQPIACPKCGSDHTDRALSLFAAFSRSSSGAMASVSGGGSACSGCSSHNCASCKH